MPQEQIQTIANTLTDSAYWLRSDPSDIGSIIASLEGAVEELRTLEGKNDNADYSAS